MSPLTDLEPSLREKGHSAPEYLALHKPKIRPVILSGGAGTRLWPLSRSAYPKQLLSLTSELSLLQQTVQRVADREFFSAPIVLASEDHRFIIADKLQQIGIQAELIMLEPMARNTAAATAAAAVWLAETDPAALMLVMPADHVIVDQAAFLAAIVAGARAADAGKLVTFGVVADRPETGYGYIRRGDPLEVPHVFTVDAFVEKPPRDQAEKFIRSGDYAWNSGIFLFSAASYLSEIRRHHPDIAEAARRAVEMARIDNGVVELDRAAFAEAASRSIDHAVMEKTSAAAVVPVNMGWSDIGAWDAVWKIASKEVEDSVVRLGDVVAIDCHNSYLRSEAGLLAVVGAKNLIVVATADAVLVAAKDRAQEVKKLVEQLARDKRPELTQGAIAHRPWGTYRAIHAGNRVQVKHIVVNPGAKLSSQMHHHRAEHWVVVSGTARVLCGKEEKLLHENQSIYIPLGTLHRLENPGRIPLHVIEVQSGSYLGEDDIVRFQDEYGRVEPALTTA